MVLVEYPFATMDYKTYPHFHKKRKDELSYGPSFLFYEYLTECYPTL